MDKHYKIPYHQKWETKEGKVLLIKEMSSIHIKSCIKMLEKQLSNITITKSQREHKTSRINSFNSEIVNRRNQKLSKI